MRNVRRHMRAPRVFTAVAAISLLGLMISMQSSATRHALAADMDNCAATNVEYFPYRGAGVLADIPWISGAPPRPRRLDSTALHREGPARFGHLAGGTIIGHLFYYLASDRLVRERRPDAHIYSGGMTPDGLGATKILWIARRQGFDATLAIEGQRIGSDRSFRQVERISSSGFPSIVDVPTPGCWRLRLRTGRLEEEVTFRAL